MTCGCKSSAEKAEYLWLLFDDPSLVPEVAHRTVDSGIAVEDSYERLVRERGSAFHEAGHTIAAAAVGAKIFAVAIGQYPAAMSAYSADASPLVRLIGFAAGHHCEGIASAFGRPPRDILANYIALGRAGTVGTCDYCKSARHLRKSFPDLSDEELVSAWIAAFDITRALFKTPEWRHALHQIVGALRDRLRLAGDDISALVDADALQAAQVEVLVGVDVNDPATWGLLA